MSISLQTPLRITITLVFLFISVEFCNAGELRGIRRNNEGVKKFETEKPLEAYDRFTEALIDLPQAAEVHLNIGTSFLSRKEYDKALSEYTLAIQSAKGESKRAREARFRALFNSAVAQAEMKKVEPALELYQKALEIYPDSVETKTNIELLTQSGGQGGSGGENDQKQNEKKDQDQGQGNDQQQQQQQQQKQQQGQKKPNPQTKPFKSEDLTEQDVGRILEELKRQEEQIRAKMQREGAKDVPPDKDW
jgi:Ca-activated chloride channel family protein